MVRGYDEQVDASPLARADVAFCEQVFEKPGRLIDLGCGTGRLCVHLAQKGFDCVGVDLSDEMLAKAKQNGDAAGAPVEWLNANLVELAGVPDGGFDCAACLFSTLGMIRGADNRAAVVRQVFRVLRPGGRFVLHVHNRWFHRLGWRRFRSADLTMPQAYGGAPLTIYHFTWREAAGLLEGAGFRVLSVRPVGLAPGGRLPAAWWLPAVRGYGYLLAGGRP
jgi:SAM-dependent methyltransferase